jgi:hypothetical protein
MEMEMECVDDDQAQFGEKNKYRDDQGKGIR